MDFDVTNVAVVAGSNVPRDTIYGPLNEFEFPTIWADSESSSRQNYQVIQITAKNGNMVSDSPTISWIRCLRASRDIHEQNIEAIRSRDDGVFIRVTREVSVGELLCGWYDESYAREIGVPHLTLQNIKGIQDYRCHMCDRGFSFPNQLKAHMMYTCHVNKSLASRDLKMNVFTQDYLSSNMLNFGTESISEIFETRNQEITSPLSDKRTSLPALTYNGRLQDGGKLAELRCQFLASINCQLSYEINRNSIFEPCRVETSFSVAPNGGVVHKQGHVKENSPKEKQPIHVSIDSDVEPLEVLHRSFIEFSTKRGHLCVYCGKFYSRKYGLKIHLRTHTGYKPLKCKICSRAFGDPSNLNKHIRLHAEGSTPYRCHHCGKVLVRRRDLVRHLKSRHPDADES